MSAVGSAGGPPDIVAKPSQAVTIRLGGTSPIEDAAVNPRITADAAEAVDGEVAIPVNGGDDYTKICNLMSRIFTGTVVTKDFRVFIRESFEKSSDGKFHISENKKELKKMLSGLTGYSASSITDEAIDYLFGNQDGTLDKNDVVNSPGKLLARLGFLCEIFTTNSRSGGPNAFQILTMDNLVAVDFESEVPGYMGQLDLQALSDAKDLLYVGSLFAASTAYMQSELVSEEDKTAFYDQYKLLQNGVMPDAAKLPAGVKKLLFVAFFNSFYNATITHDLFIPTKLMNKDTEYRKALFEGAFLDYIEGHGDEKDPAAITHNLPKNFDIETLQKLAVDRQIQKAALASAKGDRPAPDGADRVKTTEDPAIAPGETQLK